MHINIYETGTLVCWAVFALFWVVLRNRVKQDVNRQTPKQRALALTGFAVYFLFLYWPVCFRDSARFLYTDTAIHRAGVAVCVAGTLICIWSRLMLGVNWSGGVALKHEHRLVTSGPYALVRHPIYTGFILSIAGTAMVVGHLSGYIVLLLVVLGLIAKIGQEEKLLGGQFAEEYAAYRKRTKRLIPFIW